MSENNVQLAGLYYCVAERVDIRDEEILDAVNLIRKCKNYMIIISGQIAKSCACCRDCEAVRFQTIARSKLFWDAEDNVDIPSKFHRVPGLDLCGNLIDLMNHLKNHMYVECASYKRIHVLGSDVNRLFRNLNLPLAPVYNYRKDIESVKIAFTEFMEADKKSATKNEQSNGDAEKINTL